MSPQHHSLDRNSDECSADGTAPPVKPPKPSWFILLAATLLIALFAAGLIKAI